MIINGGTFNVTAEDAIKCDYDDDDTESLGDLTINGGTITINMGRGDTDAIDANGELVITCGIINITAQSAFDYDERVTYTGGTVTVNGQKITTISNSMMGGGMQGGRNQMTRLDMPSGDFGRQRGRQNMNSQNGGQMMPPEMNGQNRQEMMPPELSGQNGQMNLPTMPIENKKWSKASEWAIEELDKADAKKLIPESFTNNDLTTFITREEFAHIIIKLYEAITGQKVANVTNNPFTDTQDSEVLKAYSLGITNGTSSSTFTLNSLITREEMATMFTRAISKAGIDISNQEEISKFDDDNEIHDWGRSSIYFMANEGIIKGMENNVLGVNGTATKEQAILLSERIAEKYSSADLMI